MTKFEITDLAGSPKGVLTELNPIRDFATLRKAIEDRIDEYKKKIEQVKQNIKDNDIDMVKQAKQQLTEDFKDAIIELEFVLEKIGEVEKGLRERNLTDNDIKILDEVAEFLDCYSRDAFSSTTLLKFNLVIRKCRELRRVLGGEK